MRDPVTVHLESDWGEPVEYRIIPWGAGHGVRMLRQLSPLLKSALTGLSALSREVEPGQEDGRPEGEATLIELLSAAAEHLSPALDQLAEVIASTGDEAFFLSLLDGTTRKCAPSPGRHMADLAAFSEAYQANYLELMLIISHVLRVNFGRALTRGKLQGAAAPIIKTPGRARP